MFRLGNIVSGVLTPLLAKDTKHMSLVVGGDRMQRNFGPKRKQAISQHVSPAIIGLWR
jgi:hypothetical protein